MVSLFAFIHFCSLLSSVSANISGWLKLFPDMKQFEQFGKPDYEMHFKLQSFMEMIQIYTGLRTLGSQTQ